MPVDRDLPTPEAEDLLALTREIADAELAPKAAAYEREERFPREVFRLLGEAGLMGLPFAEDVGGGGQPYEVYLQVLEELGATLSPVPVFSTALATGALLLSGDTDACARFLPEIASGERIASLCWAGATGIR